MAVADYLSVALTDMAHMSFSGNYFPKQTAGPTNTPLALLLNFSIFNRCFFDF